MTHAERLMLSFVPSLRESPFRIAPERADELLAQMGVETWVLEIVDGPANFEAFPAIKEIEGTYAALGRSRRRNTSMSFSCIPLQMRSGFM